MFRSLPHPISTARLCLLALGFLLAAVPVGAADDDYVIGVVFARHDLVVAAEVPGRLAAVTVELGDAVARGDLLAQVDTGSLQQDLRIQRADHAVAVAELEIATLKVASATERLERRNASPDSWPTEEIAAAGLERDLATAAVTIAEARVQREQAAERLLEIKLAAAEIRAPFAGRVAQRFEDAGVFVQTGAPVVRLISSDELRVRFSVDETRTADATTGTAVRIEVPALGVTLDGTVIHAGPEVDSAMRRLTVEAVLDVPDDLTPHIRSGMSARVLLAGAG